MRREQILKICLNHVITQDLIFKPKDEKSWLWAAKDFAEGEGRMETFVIRFRDAEISKAFMTAVQESKVKINKCIMYNLDNLIIIILNTGFSK